MDDPVMLFSGALFFLLFLILGFMFMVVTVAFFKRKRWPDAYEPFVSVIIPAFNEEKTIGPCLEALRESHYPRDKVEIILVDDGSTDGTVDIAEKFGGIKVAKQHHGGKVAALNLGLSEAKSEIIITIDSDVKVERNFIKNIVRPFSDSKVGAVSGAAKAANDNKMLTSFQAIEYVYHSLVMDSFSAVFGTSFWFWGAVASYRKESLDRAGGFSSSTSSEDLDMVVNIKKAGYKTLSVGNAAGRTFVPSSVKSLFRQRIRWWKGTLQMMRKNRGMFRPSQGMTLMFFFFSQMFWIIFSFLAIPLITYQVFYWLPYNMASASDLFLYLFRWFNITGPLYALYMIPEWGINPLSIFGILSGVMSLVMMIFAFAFFREKITVRKALGIFFYFPYTLLMNVMIMAGALEYALNRGKGTFIK
ncbi:MAG: glycosyltransferase [Candidatus Aenigmarchaeota archaeon]|nr:glycosyltransferase [Candidatus Aenigmarchaeota archaeon]